MRLTKRYKSFIPFCKPWRNFISLTFIVMSLLCPTDSFLSFHRSLFLYLESLGNRAPKTRYVTSLDSHHSQYLCFASYLQLLKCSYLLIVLNFNQYRNTNMFSIAITIIRSIRWTITVWGGFDRGCACARAYADATRGVDCRPAEMYSKLISNFSLHYC